MSRKSYQHSSSMPILNSQNYKLTMKKLSDFDVKVTIIGNSSAGKTSLVTRITSDTFLDDNYSTIGAAYCSFNHELNNKNIVFKMWDTAGQERFKSLVPMYLKNSNIILIVFDITNNNSFKSVNKWYKIADKIAPDSIKILIGSKLDLEKSRQILTYDANYFATNHDMKYIECSSKECTNIDKVTDSIISTGTQIYKNTLFEEDDNDNDIIRIDNEGWGEKIQSNCAYECYNN